MSKEKTEHEENTNPSLIEEDIRKTLNPYRCPVCNGTGLVPNGFYTRTISYWPTTDVTPETCRTCKGTGIFWG